MGGGLFSAPFSFISFVKLTKELLFPPWLCCLVRCESPGFWLFWFAVQVAGSPLFGVGSWALLVIWLGTVILVGSGGGILWPTAGLVCPLSKELEMDNRH